MQEYKYRKHIGWLRTWLLWTFPLLGIILFLVLSYFNQAFIGFLFGVFLIGEGFLLGWILNKFTKIRIIMKDDAFIYRNTKGETRVLYSSISELKFSSMPYVGGWIKIISDEGSIRLTVVVEGIASFLRELKMGLDRHESVMRYDDNKLFRFFKTAAFADESWARFYEIAWKLLLLAVLSMIIGAIFSIGTDKGMRSIVILACVGICWVTGVYAITEVIFARRLGKSAQKTEYTHAPRDRQFESSVHRKSLLFGTVSYMVCFALMWAFSSPIS